MLLRLERQHLKWSISRRFHRGNPQVAAGQLIPAENLGGFASSTALPAAEVLENFPSVAELIVEPRNAFG